MQNRGQPLATGFPETQAPFIYLLAHFFGCTDSARRGRFFV
jgi:hypothetical protein